MSSAWVDLTSYLDLAPAMCALLNEASNSVVCETEPTSHMLRTSHLAGLGAEVRVQRFHSVCKACEHDKPEALIWTNYLDTNHPLSWYHLTNFAQARAQPVAAVC